MEGKCLSFLDVYVKRTDVGFETSVYRKPTFASQYFRWESFRPLKREINLISTLVHRAVMICTKCRGNGEIERIKKILLDNGNAQIARKIAQFPILKQFGPEKYPVWFWVPCIGKLPTNLEKEVKTAMVPSALAWSLYQSTCYLYPDKTFILPLSKALSSMNVSASVLAGTYGEHLNDHRIASSNMFRNGTAIDSSTPISTTQIVQMK